MQKSNRQTDAPEILNIWKRNFGANLQDRFSWLYRANEQGQPTCLILKTDTQESVGTAAFFLRKFEIDGQTTNAAQAIDLVVDKQHRSAGPAIKLQKELIATLQNMGVEIIYGVPLPAAQLITRRVGYQVLGDFTRWVKILDSYVILEKYKLPKPLLVVLSKLINFGLKYFSKDTYFRSNKTVLGEFLNNFDHSFDKLWENSKEQFNIIGNRNSTYLSWRFLESPLKDYQLYVVKKNGDNSLIGYIVFYINNNRVHIADLFFSNIDNLKVTLRKFQNELSNFDVNSITFSLIGNSPKLITALTTLGYRKRPETNKILLFLGQTAKEQRDFFNLEDWYFTEADIDI